MKKQKLKRNFIYQVILKYEIREVNPSCADNVIKLRDFVDNFVDNFVILTKEESQQT